MIDINVLPYLGYSYTLQEKRVKAGLLFARHVYYKKEERSSEEQSSCTIETNNNEDNAWSASSQSVVICSNESTG